MTVRLHSQLDPKLKKAIKKILGPKSIRWLMKIYSIFFRAPYWIASKGLYKTKNHKRILRLNNKHSGNRCFIIGSGPSINKMDLAPLENEITFGFNAFYLIQDEVGFLPTYYLIEDPFPAEDNAEEVNNLKNTTKIFPSDLRYCLEPDDNTIYIYFVRDYLNDEHPDFPHFSADALNCVYWGGTVAYMALQIAFYMGVREVYLIGIDLDYDIPETSEGDVITSEEADKSHFHPDYFGPGKRWHHPKVDRMAKSFQKAGEYFEAHGGKVFNATLGGNLECLPRVSFQELFD